ncbi:MAG TPA: ATP-binding protein [Clostridia bacterium]|nr:ATP-binding protein [Clostridia bacterium]
MREIALHILDIVQNSLAAGARNIWIDILEDTPKDRLVVRIKDDGRGMDEETVRKAADPFYTTRKTRKVGLGLPLLQANAQACEGDLKIASMPGKGTTIEAVFRLSHIDRPPLGDMAATMVSLLAGSPDVDFFYDHQYNEKVFSCNTVEIREKLDGLSLQHPEVLGWLREYFEEKERELRN